jgi:hypothetical protein
VVPDTIDVASVDVVIQEDQVRLAHCGFRFVNLLWQPLPAYPKVLQGIDANDFPLQDVAEKDRRENAVKVSADDTTPGWPENP